ncbi:MAG: hypothetical protein JSS97_10460 [Actinobacteria bacterium]|nr:hypothetical protein [Actinomycetota bacterium]
MSASFLSPRPGAETPARSPMLDPALAAGGEPALRDGWEVPASFGDAAAEAEACRSTVGFADRSELAKLELQGRAEGPFEGGIAVRTDAAWRCPLRPGRRLILAEPAVAASWADRLAAGPGRLCDLTASLAALVIAGPLAREAFARFCALDLREGSMPVGGFRPGSVARTPGFVLREAPDRFLLICGAAYAEYVWQTVALAARGLGGRPVGAAALPAVEEEPARA